MHARAIPSQVSSPAADSGLACSTHEETQKHTFHWPRGGPGPTTLYSDPSLPIQVYAICHYSGQNAGGATYHIACGGNKTFFEVGSALGHVAMYLASKGMMVVAVDPLKPNMERMRESLCLNGVEVCRRFGVSRAD